MAFLKRVSDGFWSFLSPNRKSTTFPATPPTVPNLRKRDRTEQVTRQTRSMSPIARVETWQMGSEVQETEVGPGGKRKWLPSPSTSSKRQRIVLGDEEEDGDVYDESEEENVDMVAGYEKDEDEDEDQGEEEGGGVVYYDDEEVGSVDEDMETSSDEDEDEDEDEVAGEGVSYDEDADPMDEDLQNDFANVHVKSSSSAAAASDDEASAEEQDISNIIPDDEYNTISGRKVIDITEEHASRGISTADLSAQGWSPTHIALVQKIAMRGFEPLLLAEFRRGMSYLPDILFTPTPSKAFIRSLKPTQSAYNAAIKSLEKVMDLGGEVRGRHAGITRGKNEGEFVVATMERYLAFCEKNAKLETRRKQPSCRLPILAFVAKPYGTAPALMQELARNRMTRLHSRYTKHPSFLQAQASIETSPSSTLSSSHNNIPQIYCLIASGTVVVLTAYRVSTDEVKTIAFFDFKDWGYDAWNSLALAIIVNHVRDVLVRIAEETGFVGRVIPGTEEVESDPDA